MFSSRPTFPPQPLVPLVGEIAGLLQGRNESVSVAETVRLFLWFSFIEFLLSISVSPGLFCSSFACSARQIGFLVSAGVGYVQHCVFPQQVIKENSRSVERRKSGLWK
jgi:hypothetical protein